MNGIYKKLDASWRCSLLCDIEELPRTTIMFYILIGPWFPHMFAFSRVSK